jgi:hypothetical protein
VSVQALASPARSTPEAFRRLAGGKRRRTRRHRLRIAAISDPGGVAESARASPEETLVEFDVVFLQEVEILFLKGAFSVMLLLPGNIVPDGGDTRRAYRERAVTFLPGELRQPQILVRPSGRGLLDLSQDIGETMRCAKTEEEMNVVISATDLLGYPIQCLDTAAEVSVQVIAPVGLDPRMTLFRAEDNVVVKAEMS